MARPVIQLETMPPLGFNVWHQKVQQRMPVAHRHDDVEINVVLEGRANYLMGGWLTTIIQGQMCLFWAALPHQMVEVTPGTHGIWVSLPLSWLLDWKLPPAATRALLDGRLIVDDKLCEWEIPAIRRWIDDFAAGANRRQIVELELEARIRRVMQNVRETDRASHEPPGPGLAKVQRMARFIAEKFMEPIRSQDIAQAAGVHPHYAMTLFHRHCNLTINQYLTRQRVGHAQRLLATGDDGVTEVAMASGFGSVSRFYEAFVEICGCTPRQYRLRMRRS
ncbi:MAG: helix-turn-helix domain-containing protein [Phycisphaeraceae bacterium]|nr:helix-turn-helix domain-containing protein [Phycisphaeraceae bacterium]